MGLAPFPFQALILCTPMVDKCISCARTQEIISSSKDSIIGIEGTPPFQHPLSGALRRGKTIVYRKPGS